MSTITNAPNRFKLFGAGLTLAALVIAVLAVTVATGPAWAGVVGNVPDPCGPGKALANYPDDPAAQKDTGHYALFDAYWLPARLDNNAKTGTLNNNLCPPAAKHQDKTDPYTHVTVEETTLTATDIDLRSTIIHVDNTHLADVVATDAAAGDDKLSLDTYRQVREALGLKPGDPVPLDTKVYWLRLEDPALGTGPSDLVLGFSTGLLDGKYWHLEDVEGNSLEPFHYELEAVRYHGNHADELPHVLTFREPGMRNEGKAIVVWDGRNTDVNSMPLGAGEYEHLEWVFTQPGTYVLEVHLKGHVRQEAPKGAGADWKAITDEKTVTSEVREYTFHVGPLAVNESPAFGVDLSVKENSDPGTRVGDTIRVFTSDTDHLLYSLTGPGAHNFNAVNVSGGVQIKVAHGAVLDYEAKQTYDLILGVTDGKDREGNRDDDKIDDTIVIRIHLEDVAPGIIAYASKPTPRVGETVKIVGSHLELEDYVPDSATWQIRFLRSDGTLERTAAMTRNPNDSGEYDVTSTEAGTKYYQVVCNYDVAFGRSQTIIADVTINWQPASQ